MPEITLYTVPNCADCQAIKRLLTHHGAAYTEKSATYVNLEGRVQQANRAGFPPGDAREDWAILRALSDVLGHRLPFDSLVALRRALYAEHPHMAAIGSVEPGEQIVCLAEE